MGNFFKDAINIGLASIPGVGQYLGNKEANQTNARINQAQMDFQRESNREAMAFEERMSNSAVQRGAGDLEKAGFNRILAAGGGGASTPSGSSSSGAAYDHQNEAEGVSESVQNSALSFAMAKEQIKEIRSRIGMNEANTAAIKAGTPKKAVIGKVYSAVDDAVSPVYDKGKAYFQKAKDWFRRIGKGVTYNSPKRIR